MKVRYLNLSVIDAALKSELLDAIDRVLSHGQVILGPEIAQFENKIADFCHRKYAIGVSSGTDALYMALRSLNIGSGDEVITTSMSWVATLNAIVLTGATPVFVDIREDLNMDTGLIPEMITKKTKAIVPVHYTGQMCDMNKLMDIAGKHNLYVVEDAAQAFGAKQAHRTAGSFGDISCFSMNSMKVFHSYGEAGAVLTDRLDIKDKLEALRYNGTVNRENCHYPSLNFRMQTLQAACLLIELKRVGQIIQKRCRIAKKYDQALSGCVKCPVQNPGFSNVFYTYVIQVEQRDELRAYLDKSGIETKIHHPLLLPEHQAYKDKFNPRLPVSEKIVKRMLSIPNHEKLTSLEQDWVIESILNFYGMKI
ncbi:DegT/DnrJ/EryC1/StrS family aminotransferase [Desulfobacterales bacterium HSG17]|nr:DegT/DnrJ/EryC1/StrS family aminotransferase [Desulfobacterales bacterium HSG17]